jgi:Flp pilus assembly protein TadD/mono/diheme cytochrome c family protein
MSGNWICFAVLIQLAPALPAAPAKITFTKDIAPLVFTHCAPCHHAGGNGPFPLITYKDVDRHAAQIAAVTRSRYMPPWPPEHGYGNFAGDRSLTDVQIHLFAAWVAQGRQRGDSTDLPPEPHFTSQWQLGPPDLILRMNKAFRLGASGPDIFRNFIIPSGVAKTRYVRALELRVDNPLVVHHANVVLDRTQALRKRDGEDGQPGFSGMDIITEAAADNFDPDSHFLFWKPGTVLRPEPDDMSWRLDPDTDLVVNLHLQPTGKEESIQAEIGLYFSPRPPTRFPMLIQLEHDGAIRIPPGDRSFVVTDSLTLPEDVNVLAIYPHAHYLGKLVEAWATLPDGTRRWLIRIPDWDINWQAVYTYQRPIALPKGSRLAMRITYDNSQANPRNPNHPPKLVTTGNRAEDEMGHVWLQVLPKATGVPKEDLRLALQEAVMRRRLEKYPGDFLAQYNLGALLEVRGKFPEAVAAYRAALKADPDSATTHNSLAAALLMEDHTAGAIAELRESLRLNPGYLNARYNLARALAAGGDLNAAATEYATFLAQKPADAAAQAGLGTIYYKERKFTQALVCFREAAHLDPREADIQVNLGTLLAITGDLPAAQHAFEAALRINPNHAAARGNLEHVRAALAAKR